MAAPALSARRLVALLALTAVALMTIDARSTGPFASMRSAALTVTAPVRDLAGWAVRPVADAWQGAVHYDDLAAENDELRRELAELEGRVASIEETEAELAALREATDVDYLEQVPRLAATVVTDRTNGLERIIEIDRGTDDGVRVGMPIVVGDGLVGRVELAAGGRSEVLLISDGRLQVGVVAPRTRALGIAAGQGPGEELSLDLEEGGDLRSGDRLETSGLDRSIYPGGIPVGRAVVADGRVTMEPLADLDRLVFVTVLLTATDEVDEAATDEVDG